MNSTDWSLKDESLALLRHWYLLAAAALVGGLIGGLAAYLLPPVYEAEIALTVTFNNDAIFLTPDDYKNGQLAELSDFVRSDAVLQPTLARLQGLGPHFEAWSLRDLRQAIEPRWRNIGAWQLTARDADPAHAAAIVDAWSRVVLEETGHAIAAAVEFNELDRRLTAQARSLEAVRLDHTVYTMLLQDVETWLASPEDVAALSLLADRLANLELRAGSAVFPFFDPETLGEDPKAWAETAAASLRSEIAFLERLLAELQIAYDALGDEWLAARAESHGLTAYLQVEQNDRDLEAPVPLHRRGDLVLAGAVIGVLALIGVRFGRIALQKS